MKDMKNSTLINLSLLSCIPIFFGSMLLCCIAFEWWLTGEGKLANMFLTGEFNRKFTMIFFGITIFSACIIVPTLLMLSRHAKALDDLDQAQLEAYQEKMKYRRAAEKLANQS